jgi:hypothetical protein
VSKQSAQLRFAKDWAATLKTEIKSEQSVLKTARRAGDDDRAATAAPEHDRLVTEFKNVNRRRT